MERFFGWRKGGSEGGRFGPKDGSPPLAFVLLAGFLIAWRILR
jgi:hypothetical protein